MASIYNTECLYLFAALCQAVRGAERGLIAANLGGGIIKQRIARPGQGKSGGFRTLIVFRAGTRAIFVHGFAKSERATSRKTNWPRSRNSPLSCWPMTIGRSREWLRQEHC